MLVDHRFLDVKVIFLSCLKRFIGEGGGGGGASEGRVMSKIFTNLGGGPNLFCLQPGTGHTFFGKEKNYSMSLLLKLTLLFVNKHAKSLEN